METIATKENCLLNLIAGNLQATHVILIQEVYIAVLSSGYKIMRSGNNQRPHASIVKVVSF